MPGPLPHSLFFLTDFGHRDAYVGVLHAVAHSMLTPRARAWTTLADLTHGIPPQDVGLAAWHLKTTLPYLPAHSVTVAVVDPHVGMAEQGKLLLYRPAMAQFFIGPDNGLLSGLPACTADVEDWQAWQITNPSLRWVSPTPTAPGPTFEARDRYTPIAAYLLNALMDGGLPAFLEGVGLRIVVAQQAVPSALPTAEPLAPQHWRFSCVLADHFGNLLLPLPASQAPAGPEQMVQWLCDGKPLGPAMPVVTTYAALADTEKRTGLLVGSHGHWELATWQGSALQTLAGWAQQSEVALLQATHSCLWYGGQISLR